MSNIHSLESTTYRRLAILLIIIGLLFAVDTFLRLSFIYKLWPILITILGIGLVGIYVKRNARESFYLAIGEYLICFSGLALYCNFTSWQIMSQVWSLFIAFLGMVFITLFFFHMKSKSILFIGLLLLSLSIYFFFIFSVSSQFWWVIFILVGLSILISGGLK
jgi:hypothetical protein